MSNTCKTHELEAEWSAARNRNVVCVMLDFQAVSPSFVLIDLIFKVSQSCALKPKLHMSSGSYSGLVELCKRVFSKRWQCYFVSLLRTDVWDYGHMFLNKIYMVTVKYSRPCVSKEPQCIVSSNFQVFVFFSIGLSHRSLEEPFFLLRIGDVLVYFLARRLYKPRTTSGASSQNRRLRKTPNKHI